MEKHHRKTIGATSRGYSTVIEVPSDSDWARVAGVATKQTMREKGWLTAAEVAAKLKCHRTTARDRLEAAVVIGTAERQVCNVDGRLTVLYKPANSSNQ